MTHEELIEKYNEYLDDGMDMTNHYSPSEIFLGMEPEAYKEDFKLWSLKYEAENAEKV